MSNTMPRTSSDGVIDLALPHSGKWTEGMKPEDKEIYMRVYRRRLDWEKQEALNIQDYIEDQARD
ncbi:MAG TPA: hypothetical protein QF446_11305 [Planctomycetota bacterium]|nr:hypothetical protein [Planctomycetota bacterium]